MIIEANKLQPLRLEKDTIVEALCEIRFESKGAASLLPGMLFSAGGGMKFSGIENLNPIQLPSFVLDANPGMRYMPSQKLIGEGYVIVIGEHILTIALNSYKGWSNFKALILEVWSAVAGFNIVEHVTRASLKYVNLIEGKSENIADFSDVHLLIDSQPVDSGSLQIRTEQTRGSFTKIVQLANMATAQKLGHESTGCLVDIDVIHNVESKDILREGADLLEELHTQVKDAFFAIISESALKDRGPIYESR
ncbi:hypothetical protein ASD22_11125 [Rhodanobacter sp. Root480]|uniref:TIGR04255 family protein n=1 Tax=Rhodanobacter sp. Root480 TaxID=1736542 RepID=UPI0006F8F5EC|nr:TIGR04255 family protein [Rhodanobacter sp. Root480]KQX97764.1 hypothetical protein ASD22_11125 [Rhodanobacter sp. Root480]